MRTRITSHSLAHALVTSSSSLGSLAHWTLCRGPRADELIGSYALPLPNLTKPENLVWDAEPAWYDISETSAEGGESKAGRVRLSLHWGPPAPEWGLRVVVFECRGLPRLSAFDKNDVKVQVKVEGDGVEKSKQHTTTIEDGGGDCQWAHGRGESLLFIAAAAPTEMTIEAIDEDTGSR